MTASTGPTPAERVRTVIARATSARFVADDTEPVPCGVPHLLDGGAITLTASAASPIATLPLRATGVLELLDRTIVPVADSVRSLVWIRGRIAPASAAELAGLLDDIAAAKPDPALLDVGHADRLLLLEIESVVFADAAGADDVAVEEVHRAESDPFSLTEAAWIGHLNHHHPEMIERLRLRLPRRLRRGRIHLLGLDRYGVEVRTEGAEGSWDSRVAFPRPVDDDEALCRALLTLMGCPFTRGLRART